MVRRAYILPVLGLAVMGFAAFGGMTLVSAQSDRADCPGQIVCPQTGELICRDKCPTLDANRADCPGRIVCPQTGELICVDRCPLGEKGSKGNPADDVTMVHDGATADGKPSCCKSGK